MMDRMTRREKEDWERIQKEREKIWIAQMRERKTSSEDDENAPKDNSKLGIPRRFIGLVCVMLLILCPVAMELGKRDGYSGYDIGYVEGVDIGYDIGYVEGVDIGHSEGYDIGYDEGYYTGYPLGSTTGRSIGELIGIEKGYPIGFDKGIQSGKATGCNEGKEVGYDEGYQLSYWNIYEEAYNLSYLNGYSNGLEDMRNHVFDIRNPSYSEMKSFLRKDRTDRKRYILNKFGCWDYSITVIKNAFESGYYCFFVRVELGKGGLADILDPDHAIVAFNTTDRGWIFVEPQHDDIVELIIGKSYASLNGYKKPIFRSDVISDYDIRGVEQ